MTDALDDPRILFLRATTLATLSPWYDDFVEAIDGAHEIALYDLEADDEVRFEGVGAVVDLGGFAPNGVIDEGADAGVEIWQVLGYGLDHIDTEHVKRRIRVFTHSPGESTGVSLAEHAFHLMLAVEKRHKTGQTVLESGLYGEPFCGELNGQTLGLLGFGASGRGLAERAAAFGMKILAIDAVPPLEPVVFPGFRFVGGLDRLDELLAEADYVSLHLPLDAETHHVLDREALAKMKPSAVVINVARGALIDQAALVDALESGALRGAGLDVFEEEPLPLDHPLFALDNAILTPHMAGLTRQTSKRRARCAADNVLSILRGGGPLNGLV
jgi:phosphoglycerate dehydrogenase-like enzyme